MKHALQKGSTHLSIDHYGAELCSVMMDGKERLWTADPKWWPRHSPVLFPSIGKSRNNSVEIDGQTYPMGQHGFARDMEFIVKPEKSSESSLSFSLYDTGETLQRYPFPFELHLTYSALKNGVHVRYEVFNPGNRTLPFALGAHPGFLLPETGFNGLEVQFQKEELFKRHLLEDGLFTGETQAMGKGTSLPLSAEAFDLDAIVFKNVHSRTIDLKGPDYHLEMQFGGFTDLGIWTKRGCSSFLCLEPWYGFADSLDESSDLSRRKGIHLLEPGRRFEAFWQAVWY